jgi:hypothetical protein
MLFDLRGRGRRRTVQVIYLSLALLMGGGLVLFGIGGDVQGGLFDAFSQGGGNATEQIEERVDDARMRTTQRPQDPAAWASLAEAQYQLAGQSEGYKAETGEFTGESRTHLVQSKAAWERHLRVAGDRPNANLAATMRNALTALGDDAGAVRAQEIVLDGLQDPGFGDYAQLAALAYAANQTRKGDLAADRAKELAPKAQREQLEQSLDAAKAQAAQGAAGGQTGGAAGGQAPPVTVGG